MNNNGKHLNILSTLRKVCVLCVLMVFCSLYVSAQEQRIIFSKRQITVEEAFKEIEKQTAFLISFTRNDFNLARKVRLTHNNLSLANAMEQLLNKSKRTYFIRGNHILIVPEKTDESTLEDIEDEVIEEDDEPIMELDRLFEVDLKRQPIDLDSLEQALLSRKIEYPAEIPNEPDLNPSLYYKRRDKQGYRAGNPLYTDNLPKYAIRTNLLYAAAALTPNIGVEFGLKPKSSILVSGSYNGWNQKGSNDDNEKLCHWIVEAEYRHWLCERFNGHFLGGHLFYGYYNISGKKIPMVLESKSDDYRYKGNVFGFGVSYGYQLMLSDKWNVEFNAGVGVGFMNYDKFDCIRCGDEKEKNVSRTFFAPTKLGITLMYIIK